MRQISITFVVFSMLLFAVADVQAWNFEGSYSGSYMSYDFDDEELDNGSISFTILSGGSMAGTTTEGSLTGTFTDSNLSLVWQKNDDSAITGSGTGGLGFVGTMSEGEEYGAWYAKCYSGNCLSVEYPPDFEGSYSGKFLSYDDEDVTTDRGSITFNISSTGALTGTMPEGSLTGKLTGSALSFTERDYKGSQGFKGIGSGWLGLFGTMSEGEEYGVWGALYNGTYSTCPSGQATCGELCVDTTIDENNCGACGNRCEVNEECLDGKCICIPNWSCTEMNWSVCSADGLQEGVQMCTDLAGCNNSYTVVKNQSCTPPCVPNWNCTAFGDCSADGIQTRTCVDLNHCANMSGKPNESQKCTPPVVAQPEKKDDTLIYIAVVVAAIAIAAAAFFLMRKKKEKGVQQTMQSQPSTSQ